MAFRKLKDTGNEKTMHCVALCGEFALKEVTDLPQDRVLNK
jgi:hypothetical protein